MNHIESQIIADVLDKNLSFWWVSSKYGVSESQIRRLLDIYSDAQQGKVRWGRPDYSGVTSKCGRWYLQASRDINDKPISWSVFDNSTNPEYLEDRLTEVDRLAEAKAWCEAYAARLAEKNS